MASIKSTEQKVPIHNQRNMFPTIIDSQRIAKSIGKIRHNFHGSVAKLRRQKHEHKRLSLGTHPLVPHAVGDVAVASRLRRGRDFVDEVSQFLENGD